MEVTKALWEKKAKDLVIREHNHRQRPHIVGKIRQTTCKKNKQPRRQGRRAPRTSGEPGETDIFKERENQGEREEEAKRGEDFTKDNIKGMMQTAYKCKPK